MENKYLTLTIMIILTTLNTVVAQDIQLNINNAIPTVKLNETRGEVTAQLCNVTGGALSLGVGVAEVVVSFPPIATAVTLKSSDPSGGFSVVTNDGTTIRLTNSVTLAPLTCMTATLGYTGSALGEAEVVTGGIQWPDLPPVGENPSNDNSTTSITVREAAAPVTLTSFNVDEFTNGNLLDWKIKDESGFSHFSVRKSQDLSEFYEIAKINGGVKNGKYQFLDKNFTEGINYYQLKMVDKDGTSKLSHIISIENRGEFGSSTIFPNPSPNRVFNLKNSEEFSEINLISNSGTKYPIEVRKLDGKYEVKVPSSYAAGTYYLQFINKSRTIQRKIVLQ